MPSAFQTRTNLHDETRVIPRILVENNSADVAENLVQAAENHRGHEAP